MEQSPPTIHVVKGPIVSEVHVYMHLVTHIVRLYNSSGMVFRLLVCLYYAPAIQRMVEGH